MNIPIINRETIGNVTVRFYFVRRDAIALANSRTSLTEQQHREYKTEHGYLVENRVTGELFDKDGKLSAEVKIPKIR